VSTVSKTNKDFRSQGVYEVERLYTSNELQWVPPVRLIEDMSPLDFPDHRLELIEYGKEHLDSLRFHFTDGFIAPNTKYRKDPDAEVEVPAHQHCHVLRLNCRQDDGNFCLHSLEMVSAKGEYIVNIEAKATLDWNHHSSKELKLKDHERIVSIRVGVNRCVAVSFSFYVYSPPDKEKKDK
jgi:hypothetical protein